MLRDETPVSVNDKNTVSDMPDITPSPAKATELLSKYRSGKNRLDARIVENDRWYRMRHWEYMQRSENKGDPEPTSAWLLNSLSNKHADAMDNYPEPHVLAREQSDEADAKMLSSILPVILEQNEFEQTYSDMWWRKLKSGTGVYGVFWNSSINRGLGDIDIRQIDVLNLFWEPGVTDIQDSQNLFHVQLMDNELLVSQYPQLEDLVSVSNQTIQEYVHDDSISTADKTAVIDWYYKKNGALHYAKIANNVLLYASENDPVYAERGYYDHGKYPFVFDFLYAVEGSPAGFGYLDVCKDAQRYIDKLNQVILKNAVMAARPRWFVRADGMINEEEYSDWTRDFVHYQGSGNPEEHIRPIQVAPLNNIYVAIMNNKIEELKETSGNRDFSQGSTTNGVTAAAAIAALQEAGSKLSRDMIKASYRAFTQVCYLALELVRQFYDEPRSFRIVGEQNAFEYVQYSNNNIRANAMPMEYGLAMPQRIPVFDIRVKAQRSSAFSTLAQNELAKEFYGMGFFNPQLADQALVCMEMMTFEGKEAIVRKISENGTMFQQMQIMQQQIQRLLNIVGANSIPQSAPPTAPLSEGVIQDTDASDGHNGNSMTDAARDKARSAASPV
jgi:hypothetical protein